jgi:CRP-like cAMP-binding protein
MVMAKSQSRSDFRNVILSRLSRERLESLRPHLRPVELEVKQGIYQPNQPIKDAYFVETGMISVVSIMEDGRSIEVGTIGREGVAGAVLLLGAETVPYQYFVQLAGHGYRVDGTVLKNAAKDDEEFRDLILRCQIAFHIQAMQSAACNGLHSVTQRCCRWLLMSQDRLNGDDVPLTHEFLALMLGVRRASVTDVLKPLHDRGWIGSNHGTITILDRKGLKSGSCECYDIVIQQQKKLLKRLPIRDRGQCDRSSLQKVAGCRPRRLALCAPNLNVYVERFIQTLQVECLDHFLVFGEKHFDYLVREYVEHYHTERPHPKNRNDSLGILPHKLHDQHGNKARRGNKNVKEDAPEKGRYRS